MDTTLKPATKLALEKALEIIEAAACAPCTDDLPDHLCETENQIREILGLPPY